ncbi:hypothetical protein SAMN05216332_1141, partial [Nitrosospira briensis]
RRRHSQPGIQRDRHHPHYACCCFTAHIFPHLISEHSFHALVIRDNRIFLSGMKSYDVPSCETLINVNFRAVSERSAVDLPGRCAVACYRGGNGWAGRARTTRRVLCNHQSLPNSPGSCLRRQGPRGLSRQTPNTREGGSEGRVKRKSKNDTQTAFPANSI